VTKNVPYQARYKFPSTRLRTHDFFSETQHYKLIKVLLSLTAWQEYTKNQQNG
jgi:hypothetical protein